MLKKENRLPSQMKLHKGSFVKSSDFKLIFKPNNLTQSRFGFVVKKTIDKKAVSRNRIRRVFRSCIEELLNVIKPGWDMLFMLERGIIEKDRKEVFEELKNVFAKNKLLNKVF